MARRHLTPLEVAQIVGMVQGGQTQSAVANHFNVHRSVISRAMTRYRQTGLMTERPRTGRPTVTTPREDRYLATLARRNRFSTARSLQNDLQRVAGNRVSTQTVRNRLHAEGLRSRRPAQRIPLPPHHRQQRLIWANQRRNWRVNRWRNVLFTDESRFCLDFNDGRARVWRNRNERYANCTIAEHDRYGGGSLMIWAGIQVGRRTDLIVIRRGTMTGERYRDEVVTPVIIPWAQQAGPNFIFMDDNARPHRARVVTDVLQHNNITRMDWPARSPDLNPIEHAWDILGRRVYGLHVRPQTLDHLEQALRREWQNIPQQTLDRLIWSMPRRVAACIQCNGGHTRY